MFTYLKRSSRLGSVFSIICAILFVAVNAQAQDITLEDLEYELLGDSSQMNSLAIVRAGDDRNFTFTQKVNFCCYLYIGTCQRPRGGGTTLECKAPGARLGQVGGATIAEVMTLCPQQTAADGCREKRENEACTYTELASLASCFP